MAKQEIITSITKFEKGLTLFMKIICVTLMALMVVTITASVFTRFVMFYPLNFADALAKYLMMWMVFLGSGLAIKEGEHILMDMLIGKFNGRAKAIWLVVTNIIVGIFLVAVVHYGFIFAMDGRTSNDPFVFNVSMTVPYLSVSVGAFYMIIQLFITTVKQLHTEGAD